MMMPDTSIPADDPARDVTLVDVETPSAGWIALAGGIYTMLVTGAQTAGRYCLIDMRIPDGGGPPPHRHDFEEMFTILEGSIEFTFRGSSFTASVGSTVNAPHNFRNTSGAPARMLCMCSPAGQEEFFLRVGDAVGAADAAPPALSDAEVADRGRLAGELAAQYRSEMMT